MGKLSEEDLEYLRTQAGSVGSGLLGGWSEVEYGGMFDEGERVQEVQAELAPLRAGVVNETLDNTNGRS